MRITKSKLVQIIQEELNNIINERRENYDALAEQAGKPQKSWAMAKSKARERDPEGWMGDIESGPQRSVPRGDVPGETMTLAPDSETQNPFYSQNVAADPATPLTKKKATGPSTGGKDVRFQKARVVKAWKALKAAAAADPKAGGDWKKLPYRHEARSAVRDANKNLKAAKAGFTIGPEGKVAGSELSKRRRTKPKLKPADLAGDAAYRKRRRELEAIPAPLLQSVNEATITEELLKQLIKEESNS